MLEPGDRAMRPVATTSLVDATLQISETAETKAPAAAPPDFLEHCEEFYRRAYSVAYRLLGCRDDAADTAQEAMARAFMSWRRLASHPHPEAWVARVSANLAVDTWRKHSRERAKQDRHKEHAGLPIEAGRDASIADRVDLHRALASLPRRQRQVVLLRYVGDLSEQTVAETLGCSPGTVKQHASRGLVALRAIITPDPKE